MSSEEGFRMGEASTAIEPASLRRGFDGEIVLPGDGNFDAIRRVWNAMVDRRPALIARCASVSDVAASIRFGTARNLEIGVRCGGHSVSGLSVPENGLMIDLSPMKGVRVDPERRRAWVQGGALLSRLDRATQQVGLATTAGNVSHTGVGGLTLGGGMGWLARQLGLTIDNLVSVEVVTADGELVRASESQNADLFWGLRGGGGNFGVVTTFEFRLYPVGGAAFLMDAFYHPDDAVDVLRGWRHLIADAPRQATLTAWVGTAGEWSFLPRGFRNRPLASAGYVWVGDPEDGRRLLPVFRGLGQPVAERTVELTYLALQSIEDDDLEAPALRRYWKGHYLRELTDEAIEAFLSRGVPTDGQATVNPAVLPYAGLQSYGGAIRDVEDSATAFSHRDALVEFVAAARWTNQAEDQSRIAAARRYGAALEPFASGSYVNALSDEGEAGVRKAYTEDKLARLTALKDRYDPDNVFHLNHNIRPSGQSKLVRSDGQTHRPQ
jgi:FAD/FMN-containing dehydrogenase